MFLKIFYLNCFHLEKNRRVYRINKTVIKYRLKDFLFVTNHSAPSDTILWFLILKKNKTVSLSGPIPGCLDSSLIGIK